MRRPGRSALIRKQTLAAPTGRISGTAKGLQAGCRIAVDAIVDRPAQQYADVTNGVSAPAGARGLHRVMRMFHWYACNRIFTESRAGRFATQFFAPELSAWRGQQPLWKVFWQYGVAVSSVLIAIYLFAFLIEGVGLRQILILCFAPYTAWILVSIWRCANNAREPFWGMLARFLTVAWACNATMMVVFIEMNLIANYYM